MCGGRSSHSNPGYSAFGVGACGAFVGFDIPQFFSLSTAQVLPDDNSRDCTWDQVRDSDLRSFTSVTWVVLHGEVTNRLPR